MRELKEFKSDRPFPTYPNGKENKSVHRPVIFVDKNNPKAVAAAQQYIGRRKAIEAQNFSEKDI